MMPMPILYRAPLGPQPPGGSAALFIVDPQYCFTDAGGTVQAVASDPVYVWKSVDGVYSATQATTANRPTLISEGGKWLLDFDAVDDGMTIGTLSMGLGSTLFVSGVAKATVGNHRALQAKTPGPNALITLSPRGGLFVFNTSAVSNYDTTPFVGALASGALVIPASGDNVAYHNAVNRTTAAVAAASWGLVYLGTDGQFPETANCKMRKLAFYASALDATAIAQLHNWGMV